MISISETRTEVKPISDNIYHTNEKEGSCIELECEALEFNIYFDGTWNSKENSDLYNDPDRPWEQRNQKKYNPSARFLGIPASDSISFARAPTGVDQMHRATNTDNPHLIALYVDGAGAETPDTLEDKTKKYTGDNSFGAGFGWGSTGVYSKLRTMLKQVQDALQKYATDGHKLSKIITFNVYGFSRGAATARMFCYRILKLKDDQNEVLQYVNLLKFDVTLKFVGLFDTVSSIGFDHANDVKADKQGLDFETHQVTKIVHIAAAHEYRQKFNLTNIAVAVERGYGLEFALPGCHTDIGDGLGTAGKIVPKKVTNPLTKTTDIKSTWYITSRDDENKVILQREKKFDTDPSIAISSWNFIPVLKEKSLAEQAQQYADYRIVREHLIGDGWFKEDEIFEHVQGKFEQLVINRTQISQDYPKIPTYLMIALTKKYHAYYLLEDKLKLYSLDRAENPEQLQQIYDNLEQQMLALDSQAQKMPLTALREDQKQEQPRLDIQGDEDLKREMYNRYLHWCCTMQQSFGASILQVNIGYIDHATNQFYRKIVSG